VRSSYGYTGRSFMAGTIRVAPAEHSAVRSTRHVSDCPPEHNGSEPPARLARRRAQTSYMAKRTPHLDWRCVR
jgi:hypothetical protein